MLWSLFALQSLAAQEHRPEAYRDDARAIAVIASLQDEIHRREALAEKLGAVADSINDERHIGTAFNEYMVPEHTCYVLGRLLGYDVAVKHLKVADDDVDVVTHSDENARALRETAISLDNFVSAARRSIALSENERILEWNLDCVGKLGISTSFANQEGINTFYSLSSDGEALIVLGDIERDFSAKLISALEGHPKIRTVVLGSGGGDVYQALRAGDYIRLKRLDTVLGNGCYSACPLVFMSGVKRQIWSPYPVLGFHQVRTAAGEAVAITSDVYKDILRYLQRMGVDPRFVLYAMWSAAPSKMTIVNGNDDHLCVAKVATWVQRGCSADR